MNPFGNKSNHSKRRTYRARKRWLKQNPPDSKGNYTCAICYKSIPASKMTLDHIKERLLIKSDREYHDLTNLQPTHDYCNWAKNKEFMKKYKDVVINRKPAYRRSELTPEQHKMIRGKL